MFLYYVRSPSNQRLLKNASPTAVKKNLEPLGKNENQCERVNKEQGQQALWRHCAGSRS